jgi:hypothetical protein
LCLAVGLLRAPAIDAQPSTPQTPPKKEETPAAAPTTPAPDQGQSEPSQSNESSDSTSTFDSAVGYIDKAIPSNMLRTRVDCAYDNNRPTRAEFFYPRGGANGPGVPRFSGEVQYQEVSAYVEKTVGSPQLSVFLNTPYRMIDPQFNNPNHSGFSDLSAGFKYAFLYDEDLVASFQLQTWAPTGDAHEGLGTRHTSVEPAFLLYSRLSEKVVMESELRYWIPAGGTDFAGDVLRYGIGVSYGERSECSWWLTPVVEFVGWTVLSGKEQVEPPGFAVKDAAGDTIVNAKVGLRLGYGKWGDFYVGYGRALTGAVWYKDMFRTELRINF